MNLTYFASEVKNLVNTPDLFKFYGFELDKKGFICCPFHNEKTPSFKVYNGKGGYHCFGCGEHGGVIAFVMKFFNLSFSESLTKINSDFNLGLPIDKKSGRREQLEIAKKAFKANQERQERQKEREKIVQARNNALDEWVKLDRLRMEYMPKGDEDLHPLFVKSLTKMIDAEYRLDCAEMELRLYETRNRCNT